MLRLPDQQTPLTKVVSSTASYSCQMSTPWYHQKFSLEQKFIIQISISSVESALISSRTNGVQLFKLELFCFLSKHSCLAQILMTHWMKRSLTSGKQTNKLPLTEQRNGHSSMQTIEMYDVIRIIEINWKYLRFVRNKDERIVEKLSFSRNFRKTHDRWKIGWSKIRGINLEDKARNMNPKKEFYLVRMIASYYP